VSIDIVDLPGPLGAEVRGVDVHRELPSEQVRQLLEAFDRRHLLLFPDQNMTGHEQVRLCQHFGPVVGEEKYSFISNVLPAGVLREGALPFHSDLAFTDDPVQAISLFAVEVPAVGAPTVFADAVGVLDLVTPELRSRLEQRSIVNVYDFSRPFDQRMRERDIAPGSPIIERPMVGRHSRTGVPVVNANENHTDRVVGLEEPESESLLAELFAVLYGSTNVFVLDWTVGDLVVWDNLALQHHRPDFPATARRTMQRVCIHDKTMLELVPNMAELYAAGR
jgi:taurine dioxygenase